MKENKAIASPKWIMNMFHWRELGPEYLVQAEFSERLWLLNEKWSLALTTFSLLNTLDGRPTWDRGSLCMIRFASVDNSSQKLTLPPTTIVSRVYKSCDAWRLTNRGRVKPECLFLCLFYSRCTVSKWHSVLLKPWDILMQTKATCALPSLNNIHKSNTKWCYVRRWYLLWLLHACICPNFLRLA